MATSATTSFAGDPILVDFTKKGTQEFWPGQRVRLQNGLVAIYAYVGASGVSVSATVTTETANGTTVTTSTAGAYVSMNAVSASAGEYIWVRTSAAEVHP